LFPSCSSRRVRFFSSSTYLPSLLQVDAVASEDLDTLTFNSPLLLRNLTGTDAQAKKITQLHLGDVLAGLDLTMDQVSSFPSSFSFDIP